MSLPSSRFQLSPKVCRHACLRSARRRQCSSTQPSAAQGPGSCGLQLQASCSAPPATSRCAMRYGTAAVPHLSAQSIPWRAILLAMEDHDWLSLLLALTVTCFWRTICSISWLPEGSAFIVRPAVCISAIIRFLQFTCSQANALDDEAATWMLLAHLAGDARPALPRRLWWRRDPETQVAHVWRSCQTCSQ